VYPVTRVTGSRGKQNSTQKETIDMYRHELQTKQAAIGTQITAITAKAKSENNRGLTGEEQRRFHKLEADYSALEDSIACAERSDHIADRLAAGPGGRISELQLEELRDTYRVSPKSRAERMKDPHYRAFSNMLRVRPQVSLAEGLDAADLQILHSTTERYLNAQQSTGGAAGGFGTQGGYLVPQGFSDMLEEAKKWFGGIKGVVDKFTTATGNPLPWPTVNDTMNRGRIIGQNVQVTETDFVFDQVTFNAYIGSSDIVLIPLAMIEDAFFDMDALTARLLGTRLGRLYNWKCTTGAGTIEPTGIVTAAVSAGLTSTYTTGQNYLPKYQDLVALEHTVDPAYRYNPSSMWMFSDTILKALKQLVDGNGRPLWQPGLTASFREGAAVDLLASRPTVLDHPYIINQDMPLPASGVSGSMLFGDLFTFKVRELTAGTTVMRLTERYADYLQQGFLAFQRFDSQFVYSGGNAIAVGVSPTS
jgi:HK97 family phage major capsid protein